MIILRTGVDLVEIARLSYLDPPIYQRFRERILTADELVELGDQPQRLAAAFAVKEAVSKALGCGIGPISWQDIHLSHLPNGEPRVALSGDAAKVAEDMKLTQWSVSISHSRTHAVAMVVALGNSDPSS